MKDKLIAFVVVSGVLFQFALVGFLGYLSIAYFNEVGDINEMLVGVLTGLATGIGLSTMINYMTDKTE